MARKTGILAGIIALIIAFISKIPIYPPANIELNFFILLANNIEYYIWGYVVNGISAFSSITSQFPENLMGIFFWFLTLIIGINSITASAKKAKFENSVKLYKLNMIFSLFILAVYTMIIFLMIGLNFIWFFYVAGIGYYLFIAILILNIIAFRYLKKNNIEE
ncbi:MAG: hypothetical protein GF329_18900 [Candidatus Lokiarchaeota archaeon]|nr:hypothetical protein [Candidatus Lokiarchaeota archaeon]